MASSLPWKFSRQSIQSTSRLFYSCSNTVLTKPNLVETAVAILGFHCVWTLPCRCPIKLSAQLSAFASLLCFLFLADQFFYRPYGYRYGPLHHLIYCKEPLCRSNVCGCQKWFVFQYSVTTFIVFQYLYNGQESPTYTHFFSGRG